MSLLAERQDAATEDDRSSRRLARRRAGLGFVVAAILFTLLAAFYMDEATTSCRSTVRGAPGDGTTGAVWLNWAWDANGGGPFDSSQQLTGAARGDALWQPVMIVNSGWSIPMFGLSEVVGPVCGYNAIIAAGFVTSGLAMYALAWWLTSSRLSALFAGAVFAFSGFAQMKSEGHVSGVHLALFPLLALALLRLWRDPSPSRVAMAAVPWAGLAYVDGYYLPFAFVMVGGMLLGLLVARRHEGRRAIARAVAATFAAGGAALVLLIPFAWITLSNRGAIEAERGRSIDAAASYSARWWEYLVPSYSHPWFDSLIGEWRIRNLHGSSFTESTLYLGWIVIVLAAVAVVAVRRRPVGGPIADRGRAEAVTVLAVAAVVAFVCSLSPTARLFGVPLPMPSRLIRVVFPEMRVFARLYVVVATSAVALAAVGLHETLRRLCDASVARQRHVARGGVAALTAFALFESLTFPPGEAPVWSYAQAPRAYEVLRDDENVDLVARYPMDAPDDDPGKLFLTFQPALDKPVVNPVHDTTGAADAADISRGLASLADPQTVPALRALGVDAVVLETQVMGSSDPRLARDLGLEITDRFRYEDEAARQGNGGPGRWAYLSRYYDIDVLRPVDGPVGRAVIALGDGWSVFERDGWSGRRWMYDVGQLTVVPLAAHSGRAIVEFDAVAFGMSRRLEVRDGDAVIATLDIEPGGTHVRFDAPIGRTLELWSDPIATPVRDLDPSSADTRSLSIMVSGLAVTVTD